MQKCVICLEETCDVSKKEISTDTFLALVFKERRRDPENESTEEKESDRPEPEEHKDSLTNGFYRAVGSREECRKSHLLCGTCALDFALNPTNTVCPICRSPLEYAVQLCHDWLVERERAAYMRSQTHVLRDLAESFVERARRVYVDDIERATESALERAHYRLWPETSRGSYHINVQLLGSQNDAIEWQYRSRSSRIERHCQVPTDRRVLLPSGTDDVSVTLNSYDWHYLCHDLFGIRVEPIASSLAQVRERKRKLCLMTCDTDDGSTEQRSCSRRRRDSVGSGTDVYSETEGTNVDGEHSEQTVFTQRPASPLPINRSENDIFAAQERFNSDCEDFEENVRYNTRAPRRDEMIMLMRRRRATSHHDNDEQ